jgi:hypothetical protein
MVGQTETHFPHGLFHLRIATGVSFFFKSVEDPLGGMPLFFRAFPILLENLLDPSLERASASACPSGIPVVPGWQGSC